MNKISLPGGGLYSLCSNQHISLVVITRTSTQTLKCYVHQWNGHLHVHVYQKKGEPVVITILYVHDCMNIIVICGLETLSLKSNGLNGRWISIYFFSWTCGEKIHCIRVEANTHSSLAHWSKTQFDNFANGVAVSYDIHVVIDSRQNPTYEYTTGLRVQWGDPLCHQSVYSICTHWGSDVHRQSWRWMTDSNMDSVKVFIHNVW